MKKLFALLLALAMLLCLTACGGDPQNNTDTTPPTTLSQNPTDTPTNNTEPLTGTTLEADLWTLTYDPEVWTYDEDDFSTDESWSELFLYVPNGEDEPVFTVDLEVTIDDAIDFRDEMVYLGFDEYEYAVNNAYELVNVGGVDCLAKEDEYWGEPILIYLGRVENAGINVSIEIQGDYNDSRVAQLLAGLKIHAEDIGYVDVPWYWEGEPFSASGATAFAGTIQVSSQWLPFEDLVMTRETFDHAAAVIGDKVYVLTDGGVVKQYTFDGTSLVFEADLGANEDWSYIQATEDGSLWIGGFMEELTVWKDGVQTAAYDGPDYVSMHPSGTWGISWFSGPDCEKLTFSGGAMTTAPLSFPEVSTISHLTVDQDYIYVCGYAADDSGHKVFIYDADGTLQYTLLDEDNDCLGSVTFMAQTSTGFIGLDGNMREVVCWSADGTHMGALDDGELFGTDYPWFCGGAMMDDGSILVIMTETRSDESAMELVAFKLSGF